MANISSAVFRTSGYKCHGIEFSPFEGNRLATVGGRNFGLSGNGILNVLETHLRNNEVKEVCRVEWKDSLFDVTWSEHSPQTLVTASGDGSIQLWECGVTVRLLEVFDEHNKEVCSVEWNIDRREACFISASWDHTIRLWNPVRKESLQTFQGHSNMVYCVRWSPQLPGVFLSASGDGTVGIFDTRAATKPCRKFFGYTKEVLTCDWTKYDKVKVNLSQQAYDDEHGNCVIIGQFTALHTGGGGSKDTFVTAGLDSAIRVWDLKRMDCPTAVLNGHRYPVKKVKCSAHAQGVIASVSYDFTTRIWDYERSVSPITTYSLHKEFSTGVDFNIHRDGEIADCSWDETVRIYNIKPT